MMPIRIGLAITIFVLLYNNCSMTPDLAATSSMLKPNPAPAISSVSPQKVFTGGSTEVTIEGANFRTGATVSVGGKKCAIIFVGENLIKCRVPSQSPGSHELIVTNYDGKVARSTLEYDAWALSEVELVVGKLVGSVELNSDGAYAKGDSLGATQMDHENLLLYSADQDGNKVKVTSLLGYFSKTLVGKGLRQDPLATETDPLKLTLNIPECLARAGRKLYLCLSNEVLGEYDLDAKTIKVIAGSSDRGHVDDPVPEKAGFENIRRIFLKSDVLYIFDGGSYDQYIRKLDLKAGTLQTVAGCAYDNCPKDSDDDVLAIADGVGAAARLGRFKDAVLLGDSIYFIAEGEWPDSHLRRYSIADNRLTTLINNGNGSNRNPVDGTFAEATIKRYFGTLTVMEGKLIFMELDYYSDAEKPVHLRVVDLEKQTIQTIKSFKSTSAGTSSVTGKIDTHFASEHLRLRGMHYVPGFGILLGYERYLLRLF